MIRKNGTLAPMCHSCYGVNFGDKVNRISIFRKLVGNALYYNNPSSYPKLDINNWNKSKSWNKGLRKEELPLESSISEYIGNLKLLFVNVEEPQNRNFIENNTIALLSGWNSATSLHKPNNGWRGYNCLKQFDKVAKSGLWLTNYVTNDFDVEFIDKLNYCISNTPGIYS